MVEEKARKYLALIESENDRISEIFTTLHYYSLDNITEFLYGKYGSTSAMEGSESHRALIGDILDPARRRLSWFAVHLPAFTKWLYTQTGTMETISRPFLPMQKPATYTGIRQFALESYRRFHSDMMNSEGNGKTLYIELWAQNIQNQLSKSIDRQRSIHPRTALATPSK
jgi:hypothetical protein